MLHHLTPMHHPKRRQLPLLLDPFWEIYLLDLSFLKPWSLSQLQGLYLFSNSTRRDRSLHHHRIFQCNYLIFCMHHHHCCTMVGVKFQNHNITLTPCKGWRKSGLYLKPTRISKGICSRHGLKEVLGTTFFNHVPFIQLWLPNFNFKLNGVTWADYSILTGGAGLKITNIVLPSFIMIWLSVYYFAFPFL